MTHLKPWPIVIGILVGFAGSVVLAMAVAVALIGSHVAAGTEPDPDAPLTVAVLATIDIGGLLTTVLGGFVAARQAGVRHTAHGTAVGVGTLIVSLLLYLIEPSLEHPLPLEVLLLVAIVLAGALGGRWARPAVAAA
ncbi:MAG: hypothetical protein IT178_06335 [Acidobacteria bacterium]|nr:hypothetical protein [Acidobacteriota bacterium]